MSNDLTLPGDIPGLLRRCSPVRDCDDDPAGIVTWVEPDETGLAYMHHLGRALAFPEEMERCDLDLSDATGRAHACWWLAAKLGATAADAITASFNHMVFDPVVNWHGESDAGMNGWSLVTYGGEVSDAWGSEEGAPEDGVWLKSLDALDPDDPRLLEDGSRWVDAEALRHVCLHVAGRAA